MVITSLLPSVHAVPGGSSGESSVPAFGNSPPMVRNQIDHLNASVGHLFRFMVPQDTCYDMEVRAESTAGYIMLVLIEQIEFLL